MARGSAVASGLVAHTAGESGLGVIAQDVEAVFPELVYAVGPDGYKAVDYAKLTAVLIEAVKELKQRNDELKQANEAIERRLSILEAQRSN
jgi:hypothetical protein